MEKNQGGIMEHRKLKIMYAKDGRGSRTTRMTLPVSWLDDLGVTEDEREVHVYKIQNKILISKEDLEMNSWVIYVQEVRWDGSNWVGYGDNLEEIFELPYGEAKTKYGELIKEYEEQAGKDNKNYHIDLRNMLNDIDSKNKDVIAGTKEY